MQIWEKAKCFANFYKCYMVSANNMPSIYFFNLMLKIKCFSILNYLVYRFIS
jgi:hypothetical protein